VRPYVWIISILLLGVAGILLVAALGMRRTDQTADHETAPHLQRVRGVASSGGQVDFWVDRGGRPREFRLRLTMSCADYDRPMTWTWVETPGARFRSQGPWLQLRAADRRERDGWGGTRHLAMRLRIRPNHVLVGDVVGDGHLRHPGEAKLDCDYGAYFAAGPCAQRNLERLSHRRPTVSCRAGAGPDT
jgi:hypothetical protein